MSNNSGFLPLTLMHAPWVPFLPSSAYKPDSEHSASTPPEKSLFVPVPPIEELSIVAPPTEDRFTPMFLEDLREISTPHPEGLDKLAGATVPASQPNPGEDPGSSAFSLSSEDGDNLDVPLPPTPPLWGQILEELDNKSVKNNQKHPTSLLDASVSTTGNTSSSAAERCTSPFSEGDAIGSSPTERAAALEAHRIRHNLSHADACTQLIKKSKAQSPEAPSRPRSSAPSSGLEHSHQKASPATQAATSAASGLTPRKISRQERQLERTKKAVLSAAKSKKPYFTYNQIAEDYEISEDQVKAWVQEEKDLHNNRPTHQAAATTHQSMNPKTTSGAIRGSRPRQSQRLIEKQSTPPFVTDNPYSNKRLR